MTIKTRLLTAAYFQRLADIPPEAEGFANTRNAHTRRAYENAIKEFMRFTGIERPEEFRGVTRAHVIAWRDELGERSVSDGETLSGTTIRHRMAALSSLFQYLCDKNAVKLNPVKGVKRPKVESDVGKTPALGDHQARKLLVAPDENSLKGPSGPRYTGDLSLPCAPPRRTVQAKVRDFKHERRGRQHLKVSGKGEKTRYIPLHGVAGDLINDYLPKAADGADNAGALFRPLRDSRGGNRKNAITPDGVYKLVRKYSALLGFAIGAHALRATAGGHQCTRPQFGYCQGPGMAGAHQHRDNANLRSPQDQAGRQPDV